MSMIGVPDSRSGLLSAGERNTRRLACEPVGLLIIVFSLCGTTSVHVSVSVAPPELPPSVPAEAWSVLCRYTSVAAEPGRASRRRLHVSAAVSSSTFGSFMIPLSRPCSQWSNQRCRVSTHSARRKSNGSSWPVRVSHILRGMFLASRPSHHSVAWLKRTLSSWKPCVMNTEARTLSRSLR